MTKNEKQVLLDGLRKLAADVADLASTLEGIEACRGGDTRQGVHLRGSQVDPRREVQDRVPGRGQSTPHRSRREAAFRCEVPGRIRRYRCGSGGDRKWLNMLTSLPPPVKGGSGALPAQSSAPRRRTAAVPTRSKAPMPT